MKALLLALLLCTTYSYSSTFIAFKKGSVFVNKKAFSKGDIIKEGDFVEVGAKSLAIIKFDKKAIVKLAENSKLKIKRIQINSKPTSLILKAGSLFSKVLKKAAKGTTNFQVRARSAVMGVRGTEFFTAYSQEKNKSDDLWMCVNEGVVEIVTDKSKGKVIVNKGEGVFINKGIKTTAPKKYAWTKKLNWNLDPEKGDLKNSAMDDMYQDLLDQDYD